MKKYILYFISLGLFSLLACNPKTENVEEELYNPFDTSELMYENASASDTSYADSLSGSGKEQLVKLKR